MYDHRVISSIKVHIPKQTSNKQTLTIILYDDDEKAEKTLVALPSRIVVLEVRVFSFHFLLLIIHVILHLHEYELYKLVFFYFIL